MDNIIGKVIQLTAYDGYAQYRIVEDDGEFVTLESVPDEFGYTAPLLREGCKISRANVVEALNWQRKWTVAGLTAA